MYVGAVQPFNHISSDFLQTKWYPGNAQVAGAGKRMGIELYGTN
jgi:hypothetical protein